MFTFFKNPTDLKHYKGNITGFRIPHTTLTASSEDVQYTHRVLQHMSQPGKTTAHLSTLSRCEILPSGVLSSDGLNSYIFPGVFWKVPAQVVQITTPPTKVTTPLIKVNSTACHQGLFLQLQVSKFCFVT